MLSTLRENVSVWVVYFFLIVKFGNQGAKTETIISRSRFNFTLQGRQQHILQRKSRRMAQYQVSFPLFCCVNERKMFSRHATLWRTWAILVSNKQVNKGNSYIMNWFLNCRAIPVGGCLLFRQRAVVIIFRRKSNCCNHLQT